MKYALALIVTLGSVGCSTVPDNLLPRVHSALDGVKSFYLAVCQAPEPQHIKACEDVRGSLNEAGEVYNALNEAIGEE